VIDGDAPAAPAPAPARPAAAARPAPPPPPRPSSSDELDALDFSGGGGKKAASAGGDVAMDTDSLADLDETSSSGPTAPVDELADLDASPAAAPASADELSGLDDLDPSSSSGSAGAESEDLSGLDDLDGSSSPAPPPAPAPRAAPAPAPAPAPTAIGGGDFLASLVGGGLAPDPLAGHSHAPAPAPAPAPARPQATAASGTRPALGAPAPKPASPAPAPAPAAGGGGSGWSAFEEALAHGGPLFKDEDESKSEAPPLPEKKPEAPKAKPDLGGLDLAPEDEPKAKPAAPAKPAPAPAKPKADLGGLDLAPEEPAKESAEPEVDPRVLAEPIAPKAPTARDNAAKLKKTVSAVPVAEFKIDSDDGAPAGGPGPAKRDEESEEPPEEAEPKDPAQAAVFRFERTGDPAALNEARKLFTETAAKAPHGTARAFAEAGLAKVYLLAGNGPAAEQQARASLERDPGNPFAVEIVVKVARGEAERSKLTTGLTQARTLAMSGRGADARRILEGRLPQEFPDAPQPWMVAAILAKAEGDDARFEHMLAQAWARYPGKRHGDLPLGASLDIDFAALVATHQRQKWKALNPDFLKHTVENTDAKDNMAAGTFRLAIASARIGLARSRHLTKAAKRKAWGAISSGMIGLQYYDAAVECLDKAMTLRPTEQEGKAIDVERRYAGQMRRAFDKPGIKAQTGKYKCVGIQVLSHSTQERLAAAQKDRAAREGELQKDAAEVAALCARDESIRDEVRGAAEGLHREDPIIHVEVADAELAQIRDERSKLANPAHAAPEKKGGLFSKLAGAAHAAADKVANAAKDTQLKIKESQAQSRRDEAVRKLGLTIAKDLREHEWKTPQLVAFAKRAATLEAFIDFHAEEERLAKVELEGLAKSV
jgi:hypothetical protein